jgi:hypothetical protein
VHCRRSKVLERRGVDCDRFLFGGVACPDRGLGLWMFRFVGYFVDVAIRGAKV